MPPFLCLALCFVLHSTLGSHTHIGVGIYDRDTSYPRDRASGLSDPYGRNEYDYGYGRDRIAYEDEYRTSPRREGRYDRPRGSRVDRLNHFDRDRNIFDRSYDRIYGRDGYDRLDSTLRRDRYHREPGYNRGYNRGYDNYDRPRGGQGHDHFGYDRYGRDYNRRDFQRDFIREPQGVARLTDISRVADRVHDRYDRSTAYDRYQPRGYYNDRQPRNGPGTFFGQTRYPAEGRYDRGYGRPVAGRIDGYEVRKYGWNLGDGRSLNQNRKNVLNTGYDHGFAGSYQGGYGSAYYSKPINYIAGVASRLYS